MARKEKNRIKVTEAQKAELQKRGKALQNVQTRVNEFMNYLTEEYGLADDDKISPPNYLDVMSADGKKKKATLTKAQATVLEKLANERQVMQARFDEFVQYLRDEYRIEGQWNLIINDGVWVKAEPPPSLESVKDGKGGGNKDATNGKGKSKRN